MRGRPLGGPARSHDFEHRARVAVSPVRPAVHRGLVYQPLPEGLAQGREPAGIGACMLLSACGSTTKLAPCCGFGTQPPITSKARPRGRERLHEMLALVVRRHLRADSAVLIDDPPRSSTLSQSSTSRGSMRVDWLHVESSQVLARSAGRRWHHQAMTR